VLPGAGNLSFVTLGESFVHILDYTCDMQDPYEALVHLDDSWRRGQAVPVRTSTLPDGW
jgi:hypothetical protein